MSPTNSDACCSSASGRAGPMRWFALARGAHGHVVLAPSGAGGVWGRLRAPERGWERLGAPGRGLKCNVNRSMAALCSDTAYAYVDTRATCAARHRVLTTSEQILYREVLRVLSVTTATKNCAASACVKTLFKEHARGGRFLVVGCCALPVNAVCKRRGASQRTSAIRGLLFSDSVGITRWSFLPRPGECYR